MAAKAKTSDNLIPDEVKIPPVITRRDQLTAELIAYYDKRPDVCCEELLGIRLNTYQKILLRGSWNVKFIIWIMARGLAKSWLGLVFLVLKCLLNRNILAGIIAPSFKQAKRVLLDKLERELYDLSPMLMVETQRFSKSQDDCSITFYNGSRISAVSAGQGDNSSQRGDRFHIIMADEYAQIKREIIDRVVNPSMNNKANYRVGNQKGGFQNQLLITSTPFYRFNHFWDTFKEYLTAMLSGDANYIVWAFPYQVGIDVGLYDADFIEKEKRRLSKEDFDMEYGCRFPSLSESAWIDPHYLEQCCDLDTFYFDGDMTYQTVIAIDVARVKGGANTAFQVGKINPLPDGDWEVDLVRTVTMNGATFKAQHEKLRELLRHYPNTVRIYFDTNAIGQGFYEECIKPFWDAALQLELPPLVDRNDRELLGKLQNANPILYALSPQTQINHEMGHCVKKYVEKGKIHFYHPGTSNARDTQRTVEEETQILEAQATRAEMMKIEAFPTGNFLRFDLPDSMKGSRNHRKDRWSALSMLLWGVDELQREEASGKMDNMCWGASTTIG